MFPLRLFFHNFKVSGSKITSSNNTQFSNLWLPVSSIAMPWLFVRCPCSLLDSTYKSFQSSSQFLRAQSSNAVTLLASLLSIMRSKSSALLRLTFGVLGRGVLSSTPFDVSSDIVSLSNAVLWYLTSPGLCSYTSRYSCRVWIVCTVTWGSLSLLICCSHARFGRYRFWKALPPLCVRDLLHVVFYYKCHL